MDPLLDHAPCGFFSFTDDGTLVDLNQTLGTLLGFSRIELAGWHIEKILPPGGRIFYHTYLFPLLKMRGSVEEIYTALRTKAGEDLPVLLNGVRRERDARFVNDCVCVRMIQRNQYEEQLLLARRAAEESSEAKAKLLAMMSHDLRTPLTAIYGHAQLLAAEVPGPLTAAQRESVDTIQDAARVQMGLVDDILEFARLESGKFKIEPRALPLADVLDRARKLIAVQADDAQLRLEFAPCEIKVLADPDRLQQILLNLLGNAVKFTPPGGKVSITCEGLDDRVLIHVSDTGIGIPEDHLQRIFSPFVQIDRGAGSEGARLASRGIGLGLAISRDLARAMGGEVTAERASGGGSLFTIELPADRVSTSSPEQVCTH